MPSARREIRIVNEARNLVLVRREFSAFLDDSPFPKKDKNKLILATDEAIANVVEHAYGPELGLVCVTFMLDDEKMTVRVADNGIKFKPKISGDPDIKEHIRLGLKGGLGMFLMRSVMDEVRYSTTSEFNNELDMVKFYPEESEEDS